MRSSHDCRQQYHYPSRTHRSLAPARHTIDLTSAYPLRRKEFAFPPRPLRIA